MQIKPVSEFRWKIKGKKRQAYCILCQQAYHKEWYEANKKKRIAQIKQREKINRRTKAFNKLTEAEQAVIEQHLLVGNLE